MITRQHTQEMISRAYIHAVAGRAGFNITTSHLDYGVDCAVHDVKISRNRLRRAQTGFSFDLQLKSTIQWNDEGEHIAYDLEAKTWNDMASRDPAANQLYLGLMCLEPDENAWLTCDHERTVIQKSCYWFTSAGESETENVRQIRIRVPKSNILDAAGLTGIMVRSRIARRAR